MATTVIVREFQLADVFGAHLLEQYFPKKYKKYEVFNMTEPDDKMKEMKNIIIVGGYFNNNLDKFNQKSKITVFLNDCDETPIIDNILFVRAEECCGFIKTFVLPKIHTMEQKLNKFCMYIDEYFHNYTDEETFNFYNGLMAQKEVKLLDRVLGALKNMSIEDIIEEGRLRRAASQSIIETRYKTRKEIKVKVDEQEYTACIANGDTTIADTLEYMLKESKVDIAILFRFDMCKNKTFYSIRTRKGIDAGSIASKLYKGGGTKVSGGGSIDGLIIK